MGTSWTLWSERLTTDWKDLQLIEVQWVSQPRAIVHSIMPSNSTSSCSKKNCTNSLKQKVRRCQGGGKTSKHISRRCHMNAVTPGLQDLRNPWFVTSNVLTTDLLFVFIGSWNCTHKSSKNAKNKTACSKSRTKGDFSWQGRKQQAKILTFEGNWPIWFVRPEIHNKVTVFKIYVRI